MPAHAAARSPLWLQLQPQIPSPAPPITMSSPLQNPCMGRKPPPGPACPSCSCMAQTPLPEAHAGDQLLSSGAPRPAGSPCVGTGMGPCLSPCSMLQQQSVCGTLASKAFKFWIFKWRSLSSLRIFFPPRNKLRSWLTLKASVWFYSYRVFKICGKCGRWQRCWKMRFGRGESSSMEEGRKIKFLFMHHFWYEFKRA